MAHFLETKRDILIRSLAKRFGISPDDAEEYLHAKIPVLLSARLDVLTEAAAFEYVRTAVWRHYLRQKWRKNWQQSLDSVPEPCSDALNPLQRVGQQDDPLECEDPSEAVHAAVNQISDPVERDCIRYKLKGLKRAEIADKLSKQYPDHKRFTVSRVHYLLKKAYKKLTTKLNLYSQARRTPRTREF